MSDRADAAWVRALIERNRYLVLATTDGSTPWIAPVEPMVDDDLNFYFFSPNTTRHARDTETHPTVAAVMFDADQPDYSPDLTADLNAVQMESTVSVVDESDYTEGIRGAIEAFDLPMPPYAVYKVTPQRFYVPRIENGINIRYEVDMS